MVRSIGADRVIDYTRDDFTRSGQRYELILDVAGNRSWSDCKRAMTDDGTMVIAGGPKRNRWIGPMGVVIRRRLASLPGSRKVVAPFLATLNTEDLMFLTGLIEAGKVKPVVEKRYPLAETAAALRYVGDGHAQGKVVITL